MMFGVRVVLNIHVAKFAIDSLINANIGILTFSIKAILQLQFHSIRNTNRKQKNVEIGDKRAQISNASFTFPNSHSTNIKYVNG